MEDLLHYIVENLVDEPEQITITEKRDNNTVNLELRVASGDAGKVIGRQGRIAREIRTVLRSYAQRVGMKVSMDIVDS